MLSEAVTCCHVGSAGVQAPEYAEAGVPGSNETKIDGMFRRAGSCLVPSFSQAMDFVGKLCR